MPLFLASLLGGLAAAMGSLVGRVLVALGIGFVSFTGFSTVLSWGQSQWQAGLGGLSADMAAMAGVLQIDTAGAILFAALSTRLIVRGLTGGAVKRMVVK